MELFLKTCITLETEDCVGVLTCIYSGFHGVRRNRGVLVSEYAEQAIDSRVPSYALTSEAFRSVRPRQATARVTFASSAFAGTEHRELLLISADWVLVLRGCGNVHQYFMKYAWMR